MKKYKVPKMFRVKKAKNVKCAFCGGNQCMVVDREVEFSLSRLPILPSKAGIKYLCLDCGKTFSND